MPYQHPNPLFTSHPATHNHPQAGLLGTNSLLVLNKPRFLSKFNLDGSDPYSLSPAKQQLVGLINAVEYLRVPVIALNLLTILFEMLLGGT